MAKIKVMLGGETYYDKDVPCVRGGYLSEMDTADLLQREHIIDNENEHTIVTEYWLRGQLVHRSVDMHLKTGLFSGTFQASFG